MNAEVPRRGGELVAGARTPGLGSGWLGRRLAPLLAVPMRRLVARIEARIERGSIAGIFPDGSSYRIAGPEPGFDALVFFRDWRALLRLATAGSVGWYRGWEAREWDSPDPVMLFALVMDNAAALGGTMRAHGPWRLAVRAARGLRRNTRGGALRNIHAHYDLGNDFYQGWLDATMSYSSARFDRQAPPFDLEAGQRRKLEAMVERVLPAAPAGAKVLEIGCGWGALAARLAERGAAVTAISISDAQLAFARAHHPGIVWEKRDYRDVAEVFDAIVSVEMVEAVGRAWWPAFFDCITRSLRPGGRAAIQYIAIDEAIFERYAASADFIQTYVFPGGMLVSEPAFRRLAAERGLEWRDEERFGQDYAETLRLWRERFEAMIDEGRLPPGFDERFVRLWRYYLMYCEGGFRGGGIDVVQVTLVKAQG